MFRSIAMAGYIVSVLLFSASLQAASKTVPIHEVHFDAQSGMLAVSGILPNACTTDPRLEAKLDERSQVLRIKVVANEKSEICIQPVGAEYDMVTDIDELYQPLLKSLNPNRPLLVVAAEVGFAVQIDQVVKKPIRPPQKILGQVAAIDGHFYLKTATENLNLKAPAFLDLGKYAGMKVWAYGFSAEQIMPIFGSDTDIEQDNNSASFLVTGISSLL